MRAASRAPAGLFAGHLDTVPAQENLPGRIEEGAVIGCGASDMKGGLAVMIELARWIAAESAELELDPGFLFFPREELPLEESSLPGLFAALPELNEAELVIVMEPTDNEIQAGCLGNLYADVVFRGESAHSARPWQGVNAIELALEGLQPLLEVEPHRARARGANLHRSAEPDRDRGRDRANVIPRSVHRPRQLPLRARPHARGGRSRSARADRRRRRARADEQLAARRTFPPPPRSSSACAGPASWRFEPKQAWTPVAEFAARGLDAVNFGPGATRYAHRADERVEIAQLERSFAVLRRFLSKET